MFLKSLSGRFLILTILFVMLAEVLIFVPSVARFREDYLLARIEKAQIASLVLEANDMIDQGLEEELLENAGVYNVVLRRDEMRQLMLSSEIPAPISQTFDLRDAPAMELIMDAIARLLDPEPQVIRLIGNPVREAGLLIEVTVGTETLRAEMVDYGIRILILSAVISVITAALLFFAVRSVLVKPIRGVVDAMKSYARAPEDARRIIQPRSGVTELRDAENALQALQTDLTTALRQKDRLAQLGGAVAKISHDLRNILTSAQLFGDRIEVSEDPAVRRLAPKLLNSLSRAVNLCETTLAFGKAQEPPPMLGRFLLSGLVDDVVESERLAVQDDMVTFEEDVPVGLVIRADQEQLFRVLVNLVRNARQAIVAHGAHGSIRIAATETDQDWKIAVTDTGPGLPAKAREHLFTPFQGGTRKEGTGLGLAIAAELIRGHGGTLLLDRTDETGTAFTVTLPKEIGAFDAAAE
ncbi:MAG: HAMP domain-containing sensor histidine kinase [Pseudomonadota bacterium]